MLLEKKAFVASILDQPFPEFLKLCQSQKLFTDYYFSSFLLGKPQEAIVFEGYESESRRRFDLASVTKALATAPMVLSELSKKGLSLDSPLSSLLEGTASQRLMSLSVESLIRHRSGLLPWLALWVNGGGLPHSLRSQYVLERIDGSGFCV